MQSGLLGEMNAHLPERFAGNFSPPGNINTHQDAGFIPVSVSKPPVNKDIREYYEEPRNISTSLWMNKPEIPAASEILKGFCGPPGTMEETIFDTGDELLPNKATGAYETNEDYLSTQYRLLREDSLRPLRKAVDAVRAAPWQDEAEYPNNANVGLYEPVAITSLVFSNRGLATRVAFSLSRIKKHVRWDQSKRLITGTLVALSPIEDRFQSICVLATIGARPLSALDQTPPEIDLFIARPEDHEIDPMRKWIMVESKSSFFEASRHTLLALQHMMREPFPLSEHLVKAKQAVDPPLRLQQNPFMDMSAVVPMEDSDASDNINVLRGWPSSHILDESQSKAMKRILTKRFSIVQGPPGTGKTYVSVISLKVLFANMDRHDPPIIVTCQTNHALDQLLLHVAEFETNFIRLGGRSKDKDKIKKRTLFEVRSNMSQSSSSGSFKSRATIEIKKLTTIMRDLLLPLEASRPPIDHRVLVTLGLIDEEQAGSLEMDQCVMGISANEPGVHMEQWLGRCLTPCSRPFEEEDFGMEFEEEDFELEQLKELEAEAVAQDDEDFETLRGPVTILRDNQTGKMGCGSLLKTDDQIRGLLQNTPDLTTIPPADRGVIYRYFQRQTKKLLLVELRKHIQKYQQAVLQRKIGQWEQDANILKSQRIIGMTTTGLSKYRALIASLRPKIILVEEAAETLEAPVTVACLPTLEQLILVGDYQQLRPHCQLRELEDEPYHFNLSLFERMVLNKVEFDCLTEQRRMIPEIRRLLEPIYGNVLQDHQSVMNSSNRPDVEGMGGCNSYFWTHEHLESKDVNMSVLNEKEADMVVRFFDYLILNGVEPAKVTILTFYHGQRKAIIRRIRSHANLSNHAAKIVTVDSYQGEENDIVLLSLVRSNTRYQIGFLSVDNRVCVALSRAKRGFYIFGNAEMLAAQSETWAQVITILHGKKNKNKNKNKTTADGTRRVGYQLPLECRNHGNKSWIQDLNDWDYTNGGCDEVCRCKLPCGHTCMLRCHPFDNTQINCTQKCLKRLDCGHQCSAICCDPCKCQYCKRPSGTRSLLKPGAAGGVLNRAVRQLEAPPPVAPVVPVHWHEYANGGHEKDDAEFMNKMKEQQQPIKLVDASTSPVKKGHSQNTALLLDMENDRPATGVRFKTVHTYAAAAAAKGKDKQENGIPNLMD
ncbi:hypothetical protein EJ04DRAFT_595293 [Polyplosphaeria fusca]|uniref:P-loop containing nucleoside triphosphate hydrolase protein n=1 Tax=Polyplosphaeria fusca TaxID=682080 RepID=A0A9P4UVY2_9PLEO|nr:hypothetical protein EJ04DRAFT_595293 [Polyplosphaeria fusca]